MLGIRKNMAWQLAGSMGFDAFNSCYHDLGLAVRGAAGYDWTQNSDPTTNRLFAAGGVPGSKRRLLPAFNILGLDNKKGSPQRLDTKALSRCPSLRTDVLSHCSRHQHVAVALHGGPCLEYMNRAQAPSRFSLSPRLLTTPSNRNGTRNAKSRLRSHSVAHRNRAHTQFR